MMTDNFSNLMHSFSQFELPQTIRAIDGTLKSINRSIQKGPSKTEERVKVLASYSWYYELEMSDFLLRRTARLLRGGELSDITEANQLLIEYYESRYVQIFNDASKLFPDRSPIIQACCEAYIQEKYELSIPVILTQIDGISNDELNGELFQRRNGKPKTSKVIQDLPEQHRYLRAYAHPVREITAINASKERSPGKPFEESHHRLYRHKILHGEEIRYASPVNAYKTVSLLACLCSVVQAIHEVKRST